MQSDDLGLSEAVEEFVTDRLIAQFLLRDAGIAADDLLDLASPIQLQSDEATSQSTPHRTVS